MWAASQKPLTEPENTEDGRAAATCWGKTAELGLTPGR